MRAIEVHARPAIESTTHYRADDGREATIVVERAGRGFYRYGVTLDSGERVSPRFLVINDPDFAVAAGITQAARALRDRDDDLPLPDPPKG